MYEEHHTTNTTATQIFLNTNKQSQTTSATNNRGRIYLHTAHHIDVYADRLRRSTRSRSQEFPDTINKSDNGQCSCTPLEPSQRFVDGHGGFKVCMSASFVRAHYMFVRAAWSLQTPVASVGRLFHYLPAPNALNTTGATRRTTHTQCGQTTLLRPTCNRRTTHMQLKCMALGVAAGAAALHYERDTAENWAYALPDLGECTLSKLVLLCATPGNTT